MANARRLWLPVHSPHQENGHARRTATQPSSFVYHCRVSRSFVIPADFRQRFVDVCGQRGVEMLAHLPERVEEWDIDLKKYPKENLLSIKYK